MTNVLSGSSCLVSGDSKMELERPGEEKNKRWEAKMVAKSGVESVSSESSEEEKKSAVERVRDLEAVGVE